MEQLLILFHLGFSFEKPRETHRKDEVSLDEALFLFFCGASSVIGFWGAQAPWPSPRNRPLKEK